MYRLSGFNVGDSLQNRQSMEERFAYNSRKVTDFKISFCIQDNKVTLYTLNITDNDLEMLNSSLDYYCKKYSGMSYTSKPIPILLLLPSQITQLFRILFLKYPKD